MSPNEEKRDQRRYWIGLLKKARTTFAPLLPLFLSSLLFSNYMKKICTQVDNFSSKSCNITYKT